MESEFGSPSPPTMAHRWARRIERCCCACATLFPLVFVYGLTSWAVYVLVHIGMTTSRSSWIGETGQAAVGGCIAGLRLVRSAGTNMEAGFARLMEDAWVMVWLTSSCLLIRYQIERLRRVPLPDAQLVVHDGRVFRPRQHDQLREGRVQRAPHDVVGHAGGHVVHGQEQR